MPKAYLISLLCAAAFPILLQAQPFGTPIFKVVNKQVYNQENGFPNLCVKNSWRDHTGKLWVQLCVEDKIISLDGYQMLPWNMPNQYGKHFLEGMSEAGNLYGELV